MLVIATLPIGDGFLLALFRSGLYCIDLFCLSEALQRIRRDKGERVLSIAFGWSVADTIFSRVAPFWMEARGIEFDSWLLLLALESNLSIVLCVAQTVLLSVYLRKKWKKESTTNAMVGLGLGITISHMFASPLVRFGVMLVQAAATAAFAFSEYGIKEVQEQPQSLGSLGSKKKK
jgi:hypothetical protein